MQLFQLLLNTLFPKYCLNCHKIGSYICSDCKKHIIRHKQICIICNHYSPLGQTHPQCQKHSYLDGIIIATQYKKLTKKALYQIKHNLNYNIIDDLLSNTLVSPAITKIINQQQFSFITEVPMHSKKQSKIGFNQAILITNWIKDNYSLKHQSTLQKNIQTISQKDLNRMDRLFNIQDSFSILPNLDLTNQNILLIDDVTTTGATLEECAKILKQNQAFKVWGLVIASGK